MQASLHRPGNPAHNCTFGVAHDEQDLGRFFAIFGAQVIPARIGRVVALVGGRLFRLAAGFSTRL